MQETTAIFVSRKDAKAQRQQKQSVSLAELAKNAKGS
jgi:hypothetical protein